MQRQKSDLTVVLPLRLLFIIIIGIIVYSNTLNSPFIMDDDHLIVKNNNIRELYNYADCSGTRYLTYLSFAINYRIGGYKVTGYHIFNIALHLSNAILVYLLVAFIFRTPVFRETTSIQYSSILALFSGLIYVSHPVYTQAVTNINQRSILMATFFSC